MSTDSIWSKGFWKSAAERAISTAAQSGLAYLGTAGLLNALSVEWVAFAGVAGGGALLSVLKSLAVNGATGTGPSLTEAEQVVEPTATQDQLPSRTGMPYAEQHPDGPVTEAEAQEYGTSLAEREAREQHPSNGTGAGGYPKGSKGEAAYLRGEAGDIIPTQDGPLRD